MRENQWGMGMGENIIKGKELVERGEPMKTSLKKRVGMHDGKESGKNTGVKIKLKKKKKSLTHMAFHFHFFFSFFFF